MESVTKAYNGPHRCGNPWSISAVPPMFVFSVWSRHAGNELLQSST